MSDDFMFVKTKIFIKFNAALKKSKSFCLWKRLQ